MRILKAVVLAVLSFPLLLFAADQPTRLTARDGGTSVALKVGDRFEVALPGNPTTGFTWEIAQGAGRVVKQDGAPEFHPDRSLVGSGGTVTFHLVAAVKGTTVLRLVYHRKWEKDVPPAKTFEVTVTVTK